MTINNRKHILCVLLGALFYLVPQLARADQEGIVRYGVTQQVLQEEFVDGYGQNGYMPARLTGYQESNGATRYFTRWVTNPQGKGWAQRSNRTLADFNAFNTAYKSQGYILADVSGYQTADGIRYAGVWHQNTAGTFWVTYPDVTKDQMQNLHDTIGQNGWRPHRIEGYERNGESRFISVWYYLPGTGSFWHSKLTQAQYQDKFDDYKAQGFAPVHVHSHTQGGVVYFSGIWRHTTTAFRVRTGRAVRQFQRYYNNYWAAGYNIDNFYAALTPDGVRFGGIWFFDGVPAINENSPLSLQIRKLVDGAPALGGAAVFNLTTGEEFSIHGNQTFALASTAKIGILYALLREIDAGNIGWTESVNSNLSTGTNACSYIQPNTQYTVAQIAQFMIRCSNNWATNILIQLVGRATINQRLDELGLDVTRIHRYAVGGPSAHGLASASADRAAGWENLSTPREMVKLLRRVFQDNVLGNLSEQRFWNTLRLDTNNDGVNTKSYIAAEVSPMFNPAIDVFNKAGSIGDAGVPSRHVRADAARLHFPDGQEVMVAFFMDYITDNPDDLEEASDAALNEAVQAIRDAAKAVANKYHQ